HAAHQALGLAHGRLTEPVSLQIASGKRNNPFCLQLLQENNLMNSKLLGASLLLILLALGGCSRKQGTGTDAERDRSFQEMMSGVILVGHSVSFDHERLSGEERFKIDKVSKLAGDTCLFQTCLQYYS